MIPSLLTPCGNNKAEQSFRCHWVLRKKDRMLHWLAVAEFSVESNSWVALSGNVCYFENHTLSLKTSQVLVCLSYLHSYTSMLKYAINNLSEKYQSKYLKSVYLPLQSNDLIPLVSVFQILNLYTWNSLESCLCLSTDWMDVTGSRNTTFHLLMTLNLLNKVLHLSIN